MRAQFRGQFEEKVKVEGFSLKDAAHIREQLISCKIGL
jgi:hypothetical protein